MLAVRERPVVFVTASKWTKFHRVGADKDVHRRRACELWPASADYFSRKKDDGRADAALIAAWCAASGVAESTFGVRALKDPNFVSRLRNTGVHLSRIERARTYIMEHPPSNEAAA